MRATNYLYSSSSISATPRTAAPVLRALSLLLLLTTAAAASININIDLGDLTDLAARPLCDQYAYVANYSAIGANATMRAALQNASPHDGVDIVVRVMDAAVRVSAGFKYDRLVNQMCGNLSAVAEQEAANNFSRGIVADKRVAGGLGSGARAGGSLALAASLSVLVALMMMV